MLPLTVHDRLLDAVARLRRARSARPGVLLLGLAGLLAAGVWGVGQGQRWGQPPAPPVLGTLPAFALLDSSERPFDSRQLRGRVWIADFFFTRCPGPCLAMNTRLAALRRELPREVRFVSVTVDPVHDQPGVLARYAARFGVADDDDGWRFLTGTQEAVYRLAREGFHLAAAEAEGDNNFLHSTRFALVDGRGRVRGLYDANEEADLQRLSADARILLRRRPDAD